MKPSSAGGFFGKSRARRAKRGPSPRRGEPARLVLEELETRTLLSVLPGPTTGVPQNLNGNGAFFTGIDPQIAMDPGNHNKLIEFNTFSSANSISSTPPKFNNDPASFLEGRYSTDGGATWVAIGKGFGILDSNLPDPVLTTQTTIPPVRFTQVDGVSVAFDGADNAYVIFREHSADDAEGAIVLDKFNFSGGSPSFVFQNHVLYEWALNIDPAFNPVVAVDTNQPTFTDPTTGAVQTDPLASPPGTTPKAVYVAWNVEQTEPQQPAMSRIPPVVSTIRVEASDDGGNSFTPQEFLANGGQFDDSLLGRDQGTGAAPHIVFTQGTATDPGGRLVFVWNGGPLVSVNGGIPDTQVFGAIDVNSSRPGSTPAATQSFTLTPGGQLNINAAQPSTAILQLLSQNGVASGKAVGTAFGRFFLDSATNERGHDVVTVTGTTITTFEVNANGVVVNTATTALPMGITPIAFAVGNFNSDLLTDLALLNRDSSGNYFLSIYLANPGGTFAVPATNDTAHNITYTSGVPTAIVAGNFGNDTNTDLAVAESNPATGGDIHAFQGNGIGGFNSAGFTSVSQNKNAMPVSLAVGRFNTTGANLQDLVVVNQGSNELVILTGNAPTAQNPSLFNAPTMGGTLSLSAMPLKVAVGDFNGDNISDAAVLFANSTGKVALGNGDGTFKTGALNAFDVQSNATQIAVGSFDDRPTSATNPILINDIVTADDAGNLTATSGVGDGTFNAGVAVSPGVSSGPVALASGFINEDNFTDLVAVNSAGTATFYQGVNAKVSAQPSFFPIDVHISDPALLASSSLSDISVSLNLVEPNLANLSIELVAPDGTTVPLAYSGLDSRNVQGTMVIDPALSGGNMGVLNYVAPTQTTSEFFNPTGATVKDGNTGQFVNNVGGTVFDVDAVRSIDDKTAGAPYIGLFQPEGNLVVGGSNLSDFIRKSGSALDGNWTLKITDFATRATMNPAPEHLVSWAINFTGGISSSGFGTTNAIQTAFLDTQDNTFQPPSPFIGSFNDKFPAVTSDSGPNGIGTGIALAVDNTLGSFSPHQGRIYVAYNGFGSDTHFFNFPVIPTPTVYLKFSDDGGATWSNPAAITDDSVASNFSEGTRPKFNPSLAVDLATGTLVVEYYDGRYDPAGVRVANAIQTSTDGGVTFSPASFLNVLNNATDFFTGATQTIEPVPGNASEAPEGFGDRPSGIVAYGGHVTAVFASNLNSGYGEFTRVDQLHGNRLEMDFTSGASVFSTTATYAAGPRVVSFDQGPVTQDASITVGGHTYTYNNTFAADGTRQLSGFVITFDRPVDPNDFGTPGNVSNVSVMFRSPTTPASLPATPVPVGSVTPIGFLNGDTSLPITFLVTLAAPVSMVGTYSYAIGPAVHDRIRSRQLGGPVVPGNEMDQNDNGIPGEATDAFATPRPLGGIPFQLPYDQNTEPLIIPGPHVVYTYTQYVAPPTAAQIPAIENGTMPQSPNVVVDKPVTSIFVVFDRDMNAATFTAADVVSMIGPKGPVVGNFVITPDPAGTDPALAKRTFEISFVSPVSPTSPNPQVLSGTYTLQFAPTVTDTQGNAVDTNLNAGLYVLNGTNPLSGSTTTSSYTSSTPVTIVPGQTVTSFLSVPDSFTILQDLLSKADIQVVLNISYPTDPDLSVALIAPDGTTKIPLFANVGATGTGTGFQGTVFDDGGATPIALGTAPFNMGPYTPQSPLGVLAGKQSNGQWRLQITDTNSNPAAGPKVLTSWTLRLPHQAILASSYTNNTPVTLVPGKTVTSTLSVADSFVIHQDLLNHNDIQVQLNINYPTDTDLQAALVAPDGTRIQLFANVGQFGGGNGQTGFKNTIFDDGASEPIELAAVPFDTGPFNPESPLSALIGKGSFGLWSLQITDTNPNATGSPMQLTTWTLRLPHVVPGTGLGEPVADQFSASFRVFTQDPSQPTSTTSYTAIGPASANGLLFDPVTKQYGDAPQYVTPNADAGQVNAIAVDPSDPSGNTVYVGGGTGGVWKTTNFLTKSPAGPTWIPLTDLGPTNSLNISGLAVAAVNDNPNQSVVFAVTGNSAFYGEAGFPANPFGVQVPGIPGVGLLRSTDGGRTWVVLDGLKNADSAGNILPIFSSQRDHTFAKNGLVGFKVIVDPHPTPTGFAVYVAFSGPGGGVYRSVDSGNTWTLIQAGNATDVVLAPASKDANGNAEVLYAGFQSAPVGGAGVYLTSSALTSTSMSLMGGNQGVNVRVAFTNQPVPVANDGVNPNGQNGRIVLATPALTSNPLQNTFYQGYLYAAVINASGSMVGLYLTKDEGNNWTLVNLSAIQQQMSQRSLTFPQSFGTFGTNNTSAKSFSPAGNQGNYDISLAIDPSNPNIVYLGGTDTSSAFGQEVPANAPAGGLVRIDTTKLADVYSMDGYLNSGTNGNLQVGSPPSGGSDAPGSINVAEPGPFDYNNPRFNPPQYDFGYGIDDAFTGVLELAGKALSSNYLNLFRDPNHPFVNPASLHMENVAQFNNTGFGATFSGFNYFLDSSTNYHTMLALTDPVTGQTRIIVGDDQGVFTGVDDGSGNPNRGIVGPGVGGTGLDGTGVYRGDLDGATVVSPDASLSGTRNGNLQLAQLNNSAAQPSTLAAQVAGALYYGIGNLNGSLQSAANILTTGNLTWQTVYGELNPGGAIKAGGDFNNNQTAYSEFIHGFPGSGQDIATDQTGGGTLYQFRFPGNTNQFPFVPTDFFEITPVTNGNQVGQITSRTTTLVQGADNPASNLGQWPNQQAFNFAVNPIDPSAIVVSSKSGRVFRSSGPTTGFGVTWFSIAEPGVLDGSNAQALAFGAPNPATPNILDDFVYAGTVKGNVFVTFNGGGQWTNISSGLDGSSVEQIVTDPRRGSQDAYAVTLAGVYFIDLSVGVANAKWVKLDDTTGKGALFTQTRPNFNNPADPTPALSYTTSIQADWRYAIPDSLSNPTGPKHPVLYVGGNGGVFRSLDKGKTWTFYPDVNADGAVAEGGLLPNTVVSGLNLVLGNVDPKTGFSDPSSGLNQLVVTTFGRGDFAIRLNAKATVGGQPISKFLNQPNQGPAVTSLSLDVPIPGTALAGIKVNFSGPIDPESFTTASVLSLMGPNGAAIAVASIKNLTPPPTSGQGTPPSTFEVVFATPQTAVGNYTLSLASTITDFSGNPLSSPFTGSVFFTPDTPPTIMPNPLADQVVAPGGTDVVHFTVGSAMFSGQLTVMVNSSNQSLLPASDVVLSNTGNSYTLTITPPAGTNTGTSQLTVTVTDPETLSTMATFKVTVDVAPVVPPINGNDTITLPHNQFPTTVALGASSSVGNSLSYAATAAGFNPLFDLEQQFRFQSMGVHTAGPTALVLQAASNNSFGNPFYLVRPSDGALFPYDGSGTYNNTTAGTPIATLGANVFTDPLLLVNAQPPVDYATLFNTQQQFQFTAVGQKTAGATAFVLHSAQPGPGVMGFYLIRPSDGGLFPYDGSGNYSNTTSGTPLAVLGAGVFANPNLLLNAQAPPALYTQLQQLNQQFDLQELNGSFFVNNLGHQAKWIYSPILNQYGEHFYTLTLSPGGTQSILRAWQGYPDSTVGAVVATFNTPAVYNNPQFLTTAIAVPNPPPSVASVDGSGNLTVSLPNATFAGSFKVTVTVSDGLLSASQTVLVTSTDTAPAFSVTQGPAAVPPGSTQTFAHGSFPQTFGVTTSDAEGDAISTPAAAAASFNPLFALEQQFRFQSMGVHTAGATALVLQAAGTNSFGNPFYLVRASDGGLFPYDGSGNYNNTTTGTPITTLGALVYADPTLLTNADAPVDYATLQSVQQQYQFTSMGLNTAGVTALVLHSSQPGPGVMGFYLLRTSDGALFPYDGSGNYNNTTTGTPLAVLGVDVVANPALLLNAKAAPALYTTLLQVEQQFDFQGVQFAIAGAPAFVLKAPLNNANGNPFYLLRADGTIWAYDGSGSYAHTFANAGNRVTSATVDPSVYADPTLLTNAKAPLAAVGVTASLSGGVLTVNAPTAFVGTFQVTLSASDGILTGTQSFLVTSTDTPPVPNAIPDQTASASGPALQIALGAADAEGDPVTFAAQAAGYSPAFNLQQQYHFQGMGYFTTPDNVTAYVLQIMGTNTNGNSFFLLKSDGGLYAFDGTANYGHTFANSANLIATLDPSVFTTPALLTGAKAPAAPPALVTVNGSTLRVDVSGVAPGTVFQVFVTANDGAESRRISFLVTVTL